MFIDEGKRWLGAGVGMEGAGGTGRQRYGIRDQLGSWVIIQAEDDGESINKPPFYKVPVNVG